MRVGELAEAVRAVVSGNPDIEIRGISSIEKAKDNEITFISNKKYKKFLDSTKACCIIVDKNIDISQYRDKTFIICDDSYMCFAKILRMLHIKNHQSSYISLKASVSETALVAETAYISDYVFIEKGAKVGSNSVLMPFVYIGENAVIGDNCLVYPNVTIREDSKLGNNVIVHPGSVIGSDGFGYAKDKSGKYLKIPQVGNVIIEDNVEIGANVTIDRAVLDHTIIGKGTKIDNLVQIAHNVQIGENTIVVAQTGISGSTTIGNNVTLAGQTGIAGHINIADGVIITAKSGVGGNINKPGVYSGIPVFDHVQWLRSSVVKPKLSDMYKRIMKLEKEIEELKKC